mgnify:CR=1 FL=1
MLVSKYIQIEFANSSIKAIDAVHDIRKGVEAAALNLYSRYDVQIRIPEDIVDNFSIGPHLKGVANYLLKSCNNKYDEYVVGKRLLVYTVIATPQRSEHHNLRMEKRLEAIEDFVRLLKRSDDNAINAINEIIEILKNTK